MLPRITRQCKFGEATRRIILRLVNHTSRKNTKEKKKKQRKKKGRKVGEKNYLFYLICCKGDVGEAHEDATALPTNLNP